MTRQAPERRGREDVSFADAEDSSSGGYRPDTSSSRIEEARRNKSDIARQGSCASAPQIDRIDILGIGVSVASPHDAVQLIERWISQGERNYICVTSVHGVIESRRDARLRRIHNEAGMVAADGMPLVWFARLLGAKRAKRVCGDDLMRTMSAVSELRGYRQFYYGGAEGVASGLQRKLIVDHPKLQVVGAYCPPFRELTAEEDAAIVDVINAACPDVVWVGLSTPKQERWMASHIGRIDAPVMIGVGAAFDFLAGTKRRAPVWMRASSLEWLFRLATEPRRLWRRYASIVPAFLLLAAFELLRRPRRRSQGFSPQARPRSPMSSGRSV